MNTLYVEVVLVLVCITLLAFYLSCINFLIFSFVLIAFVAVSLLVERSIHRLGIWLKKTDRKPLLAAVEKMKEDKYNVSRNPLLKLLLCRGVNGAEGDSGLVLSSDAKPRLKWTLDLHKRFIEAVNQLGEAEKATPKSVLKLMGIPGLTLYNLKSHLQKKPKPESNDNAKTINFCEGPYINSYAEKTKTREQ